LLIILNVLAYIFTIPLEYMHWRTVRKVMVCLLEGSRSCITGYPHVGHKTINILLAGFLYSSVMMASVVLLDSILHLQNLNISILICLLSGMLITRMQLAYDLESEDSAYLSKPG